MCKPRMVHVRTYHPHCTDYHPCLVPRAFYTIPILHILQFEEFFHCPVTPLSDLGSGHGGRRPGNERLQRPREREGRSMCLHLPGKRSQLGRLDRRAVVSRNASIVSPWENELTSYGPSMISTTRISRILIFSG